MPNKNLIVVYGQQGVGKTTVLNALLPITQKAVKIEGEDIGKVNPVKQSEPEFLRLLWKNIACLAINYWEAGYETVLTGSFYDYFHEHKEFKMELPKGINVFVVHLCASKRIRDKRRVLRKKPSSKRSRNWVDKHFPEDLVERNSLLEDCYIRIDTDKLSIKQTCDKIRSAIPRVYGKKLS